MDSNTLTCFCLDTISTIDHQINLAFQIYQCNEGDLLCQRCKDNPKLQRCPECNVSLKENLTRNKALEKLARKHLDYYWVFKRPRLSENLNLVKISTEFSNRFTLITKCPLLCNKPVLKLIKGNAVSPSKSIKAEFIVFILCEWSGIVVHDKIGSHQTKCLLSHN